MVRFGIDISLLRLFVLFVLIDPNAISMSKQLISTAVLQYKRAYMSNVVSGLEVCWHVLLICVGLSVSRLAFLGKFARFHLYLSACPFLSLCICVLQS